VKAIMSGDDSVFFFLVCSEKSSSQHLLFFCKEFTFPFFFFLCEKEYYYIFFILKYTFSLCVRVLWYPFVCEIDFVIFHVCQCLMGLSRKEEKNGQKRDEKVASNKGN